jgi:hypothetical protein
VERQGNLQDRAEGRAGRHQAATSTASSVTPGLHPRLLDTAQYYPYSLRPIILFANTDVSRHILVVDTSVLAKSNMDRREYLISYHDSGLPTRGDRHTPTTEAVARARRLLETRSNCILSPLAGIQPGGRVGCPRLSYRRRDGGGRPRRARR